MPLRLSTFDLTIAFNESLRYNILKNKKVLFMNIVTIPFEEPLLVDIGGHIVQIVAFKTLEHGNIKFGVNAPRSIEVHREEIYHAIKQKQQSSD
ncbi:carbon storage regulator CsrA [Legionella jordanis]|uniref:Carbon storage regulator CsrA n=2 Tax=Legionella jordanis TaxID=456 RepID=A0A0W0VAI4_9GAMM|nr:carbon storage regulator CsrA [Legionella jordanis]